MTMRQVTRKTADILL